MRKLEKLGLWLSGISAVACLCSAVATFNTTIMGESLAWLTAAGWAGTAFILELRTINKYGYSNT
jgi:hypothetical protein